MSTSAGQSMTGAADHAVMRRVNRAVVLDYIRTAETVSRAAIADATGLAKPTVGLIVDELIRAGLVSQIGLGTPSRVGGRPPVMLAFNARSSFLIGVHVGVRRTTVVIADALAEPLAQKTIATPRSAPRIALRTIARAVGDVRAEVGAAPGAVAMVGVCLPGLVNDANVLLFAPNLGWRDVAVAEILEAETGAPVVAYNASHTSLVAERHLGAAVGESDVVLVYAGTGVGAAAVIDGRLLRGAGGIAGEFGHVIVRPDGPACNCGKAGCLETIVSADAVATAWAAQVEAPIDRPPTAADVAAAAVGGDQRALAALAQAGGQLGSASAWLVNMLDPACLVLAGGLAGAGPAFVEPFQQALRRDALRESVERLRVVVSALGQEAEVRGVLLLARERASADLRIVTD